NDPQVRAVGRKDPGAPRTRAVDASCHVYLHTVGHAVGFVRGHIRKDTAAHHVTLVIEIEHGDILRPASVCHIEATLVRGEGHTIGVLEVRYEGDGAIGGNAVDSGEGEFSLCQRHAETRVGKVNAAVRSAHHVVRAVQTLTLKAVHQHVDTPIGVHACDAAIA